MERLSRQVGIDSGTLEFILAAVVFLYVVYWFRRAVKRIERTLEQVGKKLEIRPEAKQTGSRSSQMTPTQALMTTAPASTQSQECRYCSQCGQQLKLTDVYCPRCGQRK